MLLPVLVSNICAGNLLLNTAIFAGHYQGTLFLHLKSFFVMRAYARLPGAKIAHMYQHTEPYAFSFTAIFLAVVELLNDKPEAQSSWCLSTAK